MYTVDLLRIAAVSMLVGHLAAQLPLVPVPAENPMTPQKVMLGKILFWDEQLSSDDSVACGTCHIPEFGGSDPRQPVAIHPGPDGVYATDDDIRGSRGLVRTAANGDFAVDATFGLRVQVTRRTANTTLGAAYHANLFWDQRASTQFNDPETGQILIPFNGALESQAVGPILSSVEMAAEGRTWQDVRQKLQQVQPLRLASAIGPDIQAALQQNPTYQLLFAAAFGDPSITAARIAFAIASYERTLIPDDTPWDRFMAGQQSAMNTLEKDGWTLFQGNGRCVACHLAPLFTDDESHVLGLRPAREDPGVGPISMVTVDHGAFKTPTLRNAGLRPRLFHNGQSPSLIDPSQPTDPASVHSIYLAGGGVERANVDPFLTPLSQLGVTVADMTTMLEFVRTGLTDARAAFGLPPFDHPQLRSMTVAPPQVYGQGLAGQIEPFLIDTVPAFLGNAEWKLGLVAGEASTLACLGYGLLPMQPGVVYGGLPWNVDILDARLHWLAGNPGEPTHTTWRLAIPNDTNLLHYSFHLQLFALDDQAPWGVSTSRGWRFETQ